MGTSDDEKVAGNHESDVMNKMYGFEGEVKSKFTPQMVCSSFPLQNEC